MYNLLKVFIVVVLIMMLSIFHAFAQYQQIKYNNSTVSPQIMNKEQSVVINSSTPIPTAKKTLIYNIDIDSTTEVIIIKQAIAANDTINYKAILANLGINIDSNAIISVSINNLQKEKIISQKEDTFTTVSTIKHATKNPSTINSQIDTSELILSKVLIQPSFSETDSVFNFLVSASTIGKPKKKVEPVIVVINSKTNDSTVFLNHVLLNELNKNNSTTNSLYSDISKQIESLVASNKKATIEKVELLQKADTLYKIIRIENLSKEQTKRLAEYKLEHDDLYGKLSEHLTSNKKISQQIDTLNNLVKELNSQKYILQQLPKPVYDTIRIIEEKIIQYKYIDSINKTKPNTNIAAGIAVKDSLLKEINDLKYQLSTINTKLDTINQKKEIPKTIEVIKTPQIIKRNDTLILQIFYAVNNYTLDKKYFNDLEKIYQLLKQNPKATLKVYGYADKTGNINYNLKLSAERAQSVKDYFLLSKKIDYNRIVLDFVGYTQNTFIKDHDFNRRVDVYLKYNE